MLSVLLLRTIFNPLGISPTGLEKMNEGMWLVQELQL
jgi:hypothetical protein